MSEQVTRRECFWHWFRHVWDAWSVCHSESMTVVLYRCKVCGKVDTETLLGRWTIQDIRGIK